MSSEILTAIGQICAEHGIEQSVVFDAMKVAIVDAYKKEHGEENNIKVEFDPNSGQFHMYLVKEVIKTVTNPNTQLSFTEAKQFSKEVKVGDNLEMEVPVGSLGRIAAQAARYAITGKIRDAERKAVVEFYEQKLGEIVTGKVQGLHSDLVLVELEKGVGEMPEQEQIRNEFYEIGKRYRFVVKQLINEENNRHVILSRSDDSFIEGLFRMEIPEILNEQVEIKEIARNAGVRTKVAVASIQEGLDAQGACIGQRGMRIIAIMTELGDEKVDIVKWDIDPVEYIKNSLSPAKVLDVKYNYKNKQAIVTVEDDQLSLAIGREGANVRLASQLTGTEIEVRGASDIGVTKEKKESVASESKKAKKVTKTTKTVVKKPKKKA